MNNSGVKKEGTGRTQTVAICLPCLNEELTIGPLVQQFKEVLSGFPVYVLDNNSTDASSERALKAGAVVLPVPAPGKGNVFSFIVKNIEADAYILCDADGTYDAHDAKKLIEVYRDTGVELIIGARPISKSNQGLTALRSVGNLIFTALLKVLFGCTTSDSLSGLRLITRDLSQKLQMKAQGFELEIEMVVKATRNGADIQEIPVSYRERPPGSFSKLHPFKDGARLLTMVLKLFLRSRVSS